MARELKDIEIAELSLVDLPANKKKFLFFKARGEGRGAGGSAQGDGGAKFCVCPKCNYSEEHGKLGEGKTTPCAKIKCPECGTLMQGSDTKVLKGDKIMDTEMQELLKSYFGEDVEIDFEKAEELSDKALNAIKGALKLVNKYKTDFPDDLKKAVGVLAKYAGYGYGYPAKKQDVEKSGAKFSKDTLEKLKKAIEALEALKGVPPELKGETQKSNAEKQIEKLTKSIEELENKKDDESKVKLAKTLDELTERLKVVEKGTGIKKSVEGQDDDSNAEDRKWPSFSKRT